MTVATIGGDGLAMNVSFCVSKQVKYNVLSLQFMRDQQWAHVPGMGLQACAAGNEGIKLLSHSHHTDTASSPSDESNW